MEIKTSKVVSIEKTGTWDTKREPIKTFHKHKIEMENGDVGEYSSATPEQTKFVIDEEVEYQWIDGDFPKIKPHYKQAGGTNYSYNNPSKDEHMARSVGMKSAVAWSANHKTLSLIDIIAAAEIMSKFILTGEKLEKPARNTPPQDYKLPSPEEMLQVGDNNNDPF